MSFLNPEQITKGSKDSWLSEYFTRDEGHVCCHVYLWRALTIMCKWSRRRSLARKNPSETTWSPNPATFSYTLSSLASKGWICWEQWTSSIKISFPHLTRIYSSKYCYTFIELLLWVMEILKILFPFSLTILWGTNAHLYSVDEEMEV